MKFQTVGKGPGLTAPWSGAAAVATALAEIITYPQLAREYGMAGQALVEERFLEADHVERTMSLYSAVRVAP